MVCKCGYPILPPCRKVKDGGKEVPNVEEYTCPICKKHYKLQGYEGNVTILEEYENDTDFVFNKEMKEFIDIAEEAFTKIAKRGKVNMTFKQWIEKDIKQNEDGIYKGLTDREKYLVSLTTIATRIYDMLKE